MKNIKSFKWPKKKSFKNLSRLKQKEVPKTRIGSKKKRKRVKKETKI